MNKEQSAAKLEREGSETIPEGSTLNCGSGRPLTHNGEGDDIVQKVKINKLKDVFLKKAYKRFGKIFDYSKLEYINCKTDVCIICPEHGEFHTTPEEHLKLKYGCPECSRKSKEVTMSFEEFVTLSNNKYDNKFKYSCNNWIGLTKSKLILTCPKHGESQIDARTHLLDSTKYGCPKCSAEMRYITKRDSYDECLIQFKEKYGNKYIYPDSNKTIYINKQSKIKIICPVHGEFVKSAQKHLSGQGCHKCRVQEIIENDLLPGSYCEQIFIDKPYLKDLNAYIYLLLINNGEYYKIGITKISPKSRIKALKAKIKSLGLTVDIKLISSYECNLYKAFTIEQNILNTFKKNRVYLNWTTELLNINISDYLSKYF